MSGRMEIDFQYAQPQMQREYQPSEDDPFRILVVGDFSGRANRGALEVGATLAERPLLSVDVDNLESRLFGFSPRLQLPLGEQAEGVLTVELRQLDDFHPDSLYQKLDLFRHLRDLRGRLQDPATFAAAAAELSGWQATRGRAVPPSPTQADAAPPKPADPPAEDSGSMFERLLGAAPSEQPQVRLAGQQVDLSQLIQGIVGPHVVPGADPGQDALVQSVDAAIATQMRELLHHPAFQSLEAAWRGLQWLIANVETGDEIKISMLDISKDELVADLAASQTDIHQSGLYQALVDKGSQTPGGQSWSVVAGLYSFGGTPDDLVTLAGLSRVCAQAGGAFVAGAEAGLLGCRSLVESPEPANWQQDPSVNQRWQALRRSPLARNIGLTLPRFLLRLPYGQQTDEIDQFAFEELSGLRQHEALLWGQPALILAQLLAASFAQSGWRMQLGEVLDVIDLPAYIYSEDGEKKLQACGEIYLSERVGEAILRHGLMPLLSYQNRNAVRLMRFQSVADPPAGLSGPWQ